MLARPPSLLPKTTCRLCRVSVVIVATTGNPRAYFEPDKCRDARWRWDEQAGLMRYVGTGNGEYDCHERYCDRRLSPAHGILPSDRAWAERVLAA